MRHIIIAACATLALSACERSGEAEVARAMQDLSGVEGGALNDVMLTVADPNEAVTYFTAAVAQNPGDIMPMRGLAGSLVKAGRPADAVTAWQAVIANPAASDDDRVELADAQIRTNDWTAAEATLNAIPPTHETYKRYRLEAMVADSQEKWDKADSFYDTAAGLTTTPGGVYNNWGYSKLTRGDYPGAERLFTQALAHNSSMFTAKNNLVLARAAQRNYTLPVVQMTQVERAQLLHTMGLAAIKQNDIVTGKSLLNDAIETHPQHFEEAARALAALDANAING